MARTPEERLVDACIDMGMNPRQAAGMLTLALNLQPSTGPVFIFEQIRALLRSYEAEPEQAPEGSGTPPSAASAD